MTSVNETDKSDLIPAYYKPMVRSENEEEFGIREQLRREEAQKRADYHPGDLSQDQVAFVNEYARQVNVHAIPDLEQNTSSYRFWHELENMCKKIDEVNVPHAGDAMRWSIVLKVRNLLGDEAFAQNKVSEIDNIFELADSCNGDLVAFGEEVEEFCDKVFDDNHKTLIRTNRTLVDDAKQLTKLGDFANFDESVATIPFENFAALENLDTNLSHGAFSSVMEIDGGTKVAKINRVGRVDNPNGKMRIITDYEGPYLEPHYVGTERDLAKVEERLQALANEKKQTFDILKAYIPENVPTFYGFVMGNSPRRFLEYRSNLGKAKFLDSEKELSLEQLAQIPPSEATLIEVWENIDQDKSFDRIG